MILWDRVFSEHPGKSAYEIARALGVEWKRVEAAAKRRGIDLPRRAKTSPAPPLDAKARAKIHARLDAAEARGVTDFQDLTREVLALWPEANIAQARGVIYGRRVRAYISKRGE